MKQQSRTNWGDNVNRAKFGNFVESIHTQGSDSTKASWISGQGRATVRRCRLLTLVDAGAFLERRGNGAEGHEGKRNNRGEAH